MSWAKLEAATVKEVTVATAEISLISVFSCPNFPIKAKSFAVKPPVFLQVKVTPAASIDAVDIVVGWSLIITEFCALSKMVVVLL